MLLMQRNSTHLVELRDLLYLNMYIFSYQSCELFSTLDLQSAKTENRSNILVTILTAAEL